MQPRFLTGSARWNKVRSRLPLQYAARARRYRRRDSELLRDNEDSVARWSQLQRMGHRDKSQVAIINQKLALQLWPDGETPVGKTIGIGHSLKHSFRMYEVVGVGGDTRSLRLDRPGLAMMYWPFAQMWPGGTTVLNVIARTNGDPSTLAEPLPRAVLEMTGGEPISNVRTIESVLGGAIARSRFQMSLLGVFAGVSLVLAAMGIYGVVSWASD